MDMNQMPQGEQPQEGGDMKAKMAQCMALMEEIMGMMGGGAEMPEGERMAADRQSIAKQVFGG
jgi:hypothetical protein